VTADEATQPGGINAKQLECGLRTLSDKHREVLELRFKDGLSLDEIAELLDCSTGTIKSRLHYGLQKLSAALRPKMHQS
jgi:RNA polymerase sigma-70 factor (ECF subfamily)